MIASTPIAVFPSGPLVIGVPEKVPARTLQEFIAWARQNPCSMGTYAPGSVPHMVADQLNRSEGTKIQAVHYRGEAPMWVDVASGNLQVAVGSFQAFNTVSTRGVKAIAVTGNYLRALSPQEVMAYINAEQQMWKPILEKIAATK